MNTKIKTSLIAISITLGLTVLKFVFYFLSGSIAVLSEAWHSFSDVTTSLLVLFALWRSSALIKHAQAHPEEDTQHTAASETNTIKRFFKHIFGDYIEITASFVIGVFLIFISISLIINAYSSKDIIIQKPLITGIIFLLLSSGSYFLFKFLSDVGRAENSAALISDGLHSKGDMVCSSLAGVSLILYYFNYNIDKWVSFAIALLILSFGIEIIFNIIVHFHKKNKEFQMHYRFLEILGVAFAKTTYISFFTWVNKKFDIDILKSKVALYSIRLIKFSGYAIIAIILFLIVYDMGFQVQMDEEAFVERFGRPLDKKALQPGFYFKFPWPVDKVRIEKTKQIRELFLGNVSREEQKPLVWGVSHGEEIHFISGDNNFFNPYIIIHYRIKDLYKYYYNIDNPRDLLENIAYKILQDIFTTKSFYQIAITSRKEVEPLVEKALQNELDGIDTGIDVVGVNIKDIHPPTTISDAFEGVIASYQRKMEIINLAHKYQNEVIPSSRGEAYNNVSNANAYVQEEVLKSEGAAISFQSKLQSYRNNKSIIKKVLYFNHIVSVLKQKNKVLIDPKAGEPDLYLNFKDDPNIPD
ncbi:MAG: FtsH protease activity modulator HflK [Acidobacteria bacterium]|nr:FtsH protease activity modulator HflK [Acidobacteriota bacterium]